jgi:hypothetical protein
MSRTEAFDIVSFDVGIRNLAYCIATVSPADIRISAWGIISLVEPAPTCMAARRGRVCGRRAAFEKDDTKLCAKCASSHPTWLVPQRAHCAAALRKLSVAELAAIVCDTADPTPTTKAALVARAVAAYSARTMTPLAAAASASSADMIGVARAVARALDADPRFAAARCVLIENQIGPLANRMKALQGMLTQYFVLRGDAEIHYISSANKLKLFVAEPVVEGGAGEEGAAPAPGPTYAERKASSVTHTRQMLESTPALAQWLPQFDASPKKDDYADSFLQMVWYMRGAGWARLDGHVLRGAHV